MLSWSSRHTLRPKAPTLQILRKKKTEILKQGFLTGRGCPPPSQLLKQPAFLQSVLEADDHGTFSSEQTFSNRPLLEEQDFSEFKRLKISILGACTRKRERERKRPTAPTVVTLFIVLPHEREGEKRADVREWECSWRFAFKHIKPCLRHKTKKRYFCLF